METDIQKLISEYNPMQDFCPEVNYKFEEFEDKIFQPFCRLDRIYKCCDFSKQTNTSKNDDEFETVQQKIVKKNQNKKITFLPQQSVQQNTSFRSQFDHSSQRRYKFSMASKRVVQVKKTKFKDSINIQPDWITVHETQKQNIEKVPLSVIEISTLHQTGTIKQFNPQMSKIKPPYEKKLESACEEIVSSSTRDDKYLKNLIEASTGNEAVPTVYTTDKLLVALLTLKHSVYPWDILVTKVGNQYVFDKHPQNVNRLTYLELQPINENITVDMPEDEKQVIAYCEESTIAAGNWQHLSTLNMPIVFQEKPEEEGYLYSDEVGYQYIECSIRDRLEKGSKNEEPKAGQERIKVICRTTVEACDDQERPVLVKALNECEQPSNWKKQLGNTPGLITTTSQIYNSNNIAKWLCHAQLVQSDSIKIGYLSRQVQKDPSKHSLLMIEQFTQKELSVIINYKQTETWQNVRYIIDFLQTQVDGKYVLLKQSFKQCIRIFRMDDKVIQEEPEPQF